MPPDGALKPVRRDKPRRGRGRGFRRGVRSGQRRHGHVAQRQQGGRAVLPDTDGVMVGVT